MSGLDLYRQATQSAPEAEARVVALAERRVERESPAKRRVGLALVAVAVMLCVALLVRGRPTPLDQPLAADIATVPGVTFEPSGEGHLSGDTRRPVVQWEAGRLRAEVDPRAGLGLVVTTAEATVTVTGTVFEVLRDKLGTTVSVEQGTVSVACGDDTATSVGSGGRKVCPPRTASGLLLRARAREASGAPPSELVDTLEAARRAGPTGVLAEEIEAQYVLSLIRVGRTEEAARLGADFLAKNPSVRADDVRAALAGIPAP